jgi:hypothetical protein
MFVFSEAKQGKSLSVGLQPTVTRFAILALLLSAGIPSTLVVLDRWFGNQRVLDFGSQWWCVTEFLCRPGWHPYFLIIFLCTFMVIILVSVIGAERIDTLEETFLAADVQAKNDTQSRIGFALIVLGLSGVLITAVRLIARGGMVGWAYFLICLSYLTGCFLYSTPLTKVWQYLRSKWALILVYAMGWWVVSWFLFNLFARQEISIFLSTLVIGATFILYRMRRELSPSYWLFLLSLVIFTLRLNAWYYSFVGDEFAFYGWAKLIAREHTIVDIGNYLFNGTIVFETHTYIASLLQAASIKLFDDLNFGWRFASILASALSIPFFYAFFRTFFVRWVAFSATFFIAVSHYLISFSRIGYDNTQALLAMGMALAAAAWAIRNNSRIAFLATGVALAFCFYVFPAALYIPPIVLWILLSYRPPWRGRAWLHWGLLILTTLIIILPLFSQPYYWESKLQGLVSLNSNQSLTTVVQNILGQFGYAFYSFLFIINDSHFVTVAHMDPLTAVFILIGCGVLFRRLGRDKFARTILSSWAMLILFVGATHQYLEPPNTRMILLVPWLGMVAAIGLQWLGARFKAGGQLPWLSRGLLTGLLMSVFALNLYQAYVVSVQQEINEPNFESLFSRVGQTLGSQPPNLPHAIMFVSDPSDYDISLLREILNMEYFSIEVRETDITSLDPHNVESSLKAADQIVIFSPFLDLSTRAVYENLLDVDQKSQCQMPWGDHTIDVWYPKETPSPCREPSPMPVRFPNPLDLIGIALLSIYLGRHQLWNRITALSISLAQWREAWPLRVRFQYKTLKTSPRASNGYDSDIAYSPYPQFLGVSGVVIDLKVQVNIPPLSQSVTGEARIADSQNSDGTPELPPPTSPMQ